MTETNIRGFVLPDDRQDLLVVSRPGDERSSAFTHLPKFKGLNRPVVGLDL